MLEHTFIHFPQCETGSWSKQLEVEFHSSTLHELHEIVIGLRTVAGHVIKVSKTLPYYFPTLFSKNAIHPLDCSGQEVPAESTGKGTELTVSFGVLVNTVCSKHG